MKGSNWFTFRCGLVLFAAIFSAVVGPAALSRSNVALEQQKTLAEKLGYAKDARLLIIQSDLAMMHSTDRAAFEALEKRWITSATIIVPAPWFPEAAAFARAHPDGDYGLHL